MCKFEACAWAWDTNAEGYPGCFPKPRQVGGGKSRTGASGKGKDGKDGKGTCTALAKARAGKDPAGTAGAVHVDEKEGAREREVAMGVMEVAVVIPISVDITTPDE